MRILPNNTLIRTYIQICSCMIILLCGCGSIFISPTEKDLASSTEQKNLSSIPFTSTQVLNTISTFDDTIIPWKDARTQAYIEFRKYEAAQFGWTHAHLSKKAIVVFDTTFQPLYYEFIVHTKQGEALGTITTYARKESTAIISHILPFIRNYTYLNSKGDMYVQIAQNYPYTTLVAVPRKSVNGANFFIDSRTGEVTNPISFTSFEEQMEYYRSLSPEILLEQTKMTHSDLEQEITEYYTYQQKQQIEIDTYWNTVDPLIQNLREAKDEEIDLYMGTTKFIIPYNKDVHKKYLVTDNLYMGDNLLNTRWNGWCMPSTVAWIYRLYFQSFDGKYLPIHGSSFSSYNNETCEFCSTHKGNTSSYQYWTKKNNSWHLSTNLSEIKPISEKIDGGLYYSLAKIGNLSSEGGVAYHRLDNMMEAISKYKYTFRYSITGMSKVFDQLYNKKKPVVIGMKLNTNRDEFLGHGFTLVGVHKIHTTRMDKRLHIPKTTTHYRYLIHDNGYLTGNVSNIPSGDHSNFGNTDYKQPYNYAPYWVEHGALLNAQAPKSYGGYLLVFMLE